MDLNQPQDFLGDRISWSEEVGGGWNLCREWVRHLVCRWAYERADPYVNDQVIPWTPRNIVGHY